MKNRFDIPALYSLSESVITIIQRATPLELLQLKNDCEVAATSNCWWIAHLLSNPILEIANNELKLREEEKPQTEVEG